jgi:hypothetical protein
MLGREGHRQRRRSRAGDDGGGGSLAAFLVLCFSCFRGGGRRREAARGWGPVVPLFRYFWNRYGVQIEDTAEYCGRWGLLHRSKSY